MGCNVHRVRGACIPFSCDWIFKANAMRASVGVGNVSNIKQAVFHSLSIGSVAVISTLSSYSVAHAEQEIFATRPEVIVTATRTNEPVRDVMAPVVVISRKQIEQSLSTDLTDLLSNHAGIELGRNGGIGQPVSIFIRGANSSHTLVLIDGVRINPATFGTASLQNIAPETVERIEVVKGPRSTLYGSDAIGGVINIITRKPSNGLSADTSLGYGSFDTQQANGTVNLGTDKYHFGGSVSKIKSDGFPTRTNSVIDSRYDNLALTTHAGTKIGPLDTGVRFYQAEGTSAYLNGPTAPVDQDFLDRIVRADFGMDATDNWSTRLVLSRMDNRIDQNQPLTFIPGEMDYLNTRRDMADWQNDLSLGDHHKVTMGAGYTDETAHALSYGSLYNRKTYITNIYAQDQITFDAHAVLLAAGYNDYSTFGSHTTWNAEYGYEINGDMRVIAAVGTGFRAPSATDLYGFGGNPNLQPEISRNVELSWRYRITSNIGVSLSAFQNDVDDLIAFDNATFIVKNIAQARIRGYELGYSHKGTDWEFHAEAIYQNPRDRNTRQLLLRRAQRSVKTGYTQTIGPVDLGVDVSWSGKRYDFGNVELKSYFLAGLHSRYRVTDNFSVLAQVDNLFNTQYQLANGYNTADRSGSLAVRWTLR
jgi:vitamin B12 transporter